MVSSIRTLLTTSRNPTARVRTLCNDLSHVIPNVVRVNRGKMTKDEVAEKALEHDTDHVVIVDRWQGGPGSIKLFRVGESGLVLTPPIIHITDTRLRREFGVSKVKPARSIVVLAPETSVEALRFAEACSKFFGVPTLSMDEAVKVAPTLMCVSRDKVNRIVITFMVEPNHVEVGPRITVSSVEW